MVDDDDRIAMPLDVRQSFFQDAPAQQIDRQAMLGGGSESAVQTGMIRVHRQAVAHSYANAACAWRGRPFRHHIVNRWIGCVYRRHNPKLIRIGVINLERVARIVFIGTERRDHIAPSTPTLFIAATISSPVAESSPCEGLAQARPRVISNE